MSIVFGDVMMLCLCFVFCRRAKCFLRRKRVSLQFANSSSITTTTHFRCAAQSYRDLITPSTSSQPQPITSILTASKLRHNPVRFLPDALLSILIVVKLFCCRFSNPDLGVFFHCLLKRSYNLVRVV